LHASYIYSTAVSAVSLVYSGPTDKLKQFLP